jgi:hypothetical protein
MLNNIRMMTRKIYGRRRLQLTVPAYKPANKEALELTQLHHFWRVVEREGDAKQTAVVSLLIGCLDRPIEIEKLNFDDVDFDMMELKIRLGKTGNRLINIPDFTAAALKAWMEPRRPCPDPKDPKALFWSSRTKKRITTSYIRHRLRALRLKAGIKRSVYPKLFRDTGITTLFNLGVNPKIIAQHAGHKNVSTTMIYNQPTKGDHRRLIRGAYGRLMRQGGKSKQEVMDELIERYQHGDVKLEELQAIMSLGVTREADVGALKVLQGLLHIRSASRPRKRRAHRNNSERYDVHVIGPQPRVIRGLSKTQAMEIRHAIGKNGSRTIIKRVRATET